MEILLNLNTVGIRKYKKLCQSEQPKNILNLPKNV